MQKYRTITSDESKELLRNADNLTTVIDIHMKSFAENELSIILGKKAVRKFYLTVINSKYSSIQIISNGNIGGFMVYFDDYDEFLKEFRSKLLYNEINYLSVLRHFGSFFSHLKTQYDVKKIISPEIFSKYLGAIAIQVPNKDRIQAYVILMDLYKKIVEKEFKSKCWGSCREENIIANKILLSVGMLKVGNVGKRPKIFLYERK